MPPEPGVSLGLNIVDFRVQLGVKRWLRTDLRLRDGDLPLIKAYKDRDLLLETGGHLANVGLENRWGSKPPPWSKTIEWTERSSLGWRITGF